MISEMLAPAGCIWGIDLFGPILQLVELVLRAIEPHKENGSEHRQNHRDNCIHDLNSNP
jgi:hypothetical protein